MSEFDGFGGGFDVSDDDNNQSAFSMTAVMGRKRKRKRGAETFNTFVIILPFSIPIKHS